MSKECAILWCKNTRLVYSGVDAMVLGGIPTETYCYDCANIYNHIAGKLSREAVA